MGRAQRRICCDGLPQQRLGAHVVSLAPPRSAQRVEERSAVGPQRERLPRVSERLVEASLLKIDQGEEVQQTRVWGGGQRLMAALARLCETPFLEAAQRCVDVFCDGARGVHDAAV